MTDVCFDYSNGEWDRQMKRMCKCGHSLLMHAFIMNNYEGKTVFWTSQCTICKFDKENKKFICEKFTPVGD